MRGEGRASHTFGYIWPSENSPWCPELVRFPPAGKRSVAGSGGLRGGFWQVEMHGTGATHHSDTLLGITTITGKTFLTGS